MNSWIGPIAVCLFVLFFGIIIGRAGSKYSRCEMRKLKQDKEKLINFIESNILDEEKALGLTEKHESDHPGYEVYQDISAGLTVVHFVRWLYENKIKFIRTLE